MPFTKMHGTGNDYIYIDLFGKALPSLERRVELAIQMSDRHFGAGGDGVIFIEPASDGSDVQMRMFNADGSEGRMCGNGSRCVALYMTQRRGFAGESLKLQTLSGVKILRKVPGGFEVDMGEPGLAAQDVPVLASEPERLKLEAGGREFTLHCLSMGNPHAVTVWEDLSTLEIARFGPVLEHNALFPERVNIEFIQPEGEALRTRVWERGSGETLACGTGACASAVAAIRMGLVPRRPVTVRLLGGDLRIDWRESDNHVYMTGPAAFVFDGSWPGEL
ncbi:MAG: diaminopimelate epimerase [Christensenellaceae bacterium]|nr:diaminopimelate epimerase [Christensenellaceae bacterium]